MTPRRNRRGNYAILFAFSIIVLLGFGALTLDTSYMRLAQSQCQDVADAASQAAVVVLRDTGDTRAATEAAQTVVDNNVVVGEPAVLEEIIFGSWDEQLRLFEPNSPSRNGVSVTVSRSGDGAPQFLLAQLFGHERFSVRARATSATRSLHVVIAMDITNSWKREDFKNARRAAVQFLDAMRSTHSERDKIGMTVFAGRYAWEFTPLTYLSDEDRIDEIRDDWSKMWTAHATWSGYNPPRNYPHMPREFDDEKGTDHTTGLHQARQMFKEQEDRTAFQALIMLTDGIPHRLKTNHGKERRRRRYVENRWREFQGSVPRNKATIRRESIALTEALWRDMGVHTWVVSFKKNDWFMRSMPQGQGAFLLENDSRALGAIFEDIAGSLPLAIVE